MTRIYENVDGERDVPLYSLTQAIKRTMLGVHLSLFFNLREFLLSRKKKNQRLNRSNRKKKREIMDRRMVKERAMAKWLAHVSNQTL